MVKSHRQRLVWALLAAVTAAGCVAGLASAAAPRADAGRRVLLITIDGLRPDVALRARMPNLRDLMSKGSFTFWARTTGVAVTLPAHTTLLTGVSPETHGVTWNTNIPIDRLPNWPKAPTIFELAKAAGYTTAMAAGKGKFCVFQKPGALDWALVPAKGAFSDEQVAEGAARIIREHQPIVMLVHFPSCDAVGHAKGWGSPEQVRAAASADTALGEVLKALDDAGVRDKTLIILAADHGGAGYTHGGPDPRSQHIPWIVAGPGVRADHDLTLDRGLTVNIADSFATAMDYLGLAIPPGCEGKAVRRIYAAVPAGKRGE